MNRYVLDGIVRDLEAGKRLLVTSSSMIVNRACFEHLADSLPWQKVVRANGQERIEHESGGVAEFRSVGRGVRGSSADVVVVLDGLRGWRGVKSELAPIAPEIIDCA